MFLSISLHDSRFWKLCSNWIVSSAPSALLFSLPALLNRFCKMDASDTPMPAPVAGCLSCGSQTKDSSKYAKHVKHTSSTTRDPIVEMKFVDTLEGAYKMVASTRGRVSFQCYYKGTSFPTIFDNVNKALLDGLVMQCCLMFDPDDTGHLFELIDSIENRLCLIEAKYMSAKDFDFDTVWLNETGEKSILSLENLVRHHHGPC